MAGCLSCTLIPRRAAAQGHARDALSSHLADAEAWLTLGQALLAKQQYEAAEQCLQAGSQLLQCSPVLSYRCLPVVIL